MAASNGTPLTVARIGRIPQFVVDGAEALGQVDRIDAARWVATSAPLADLHLDPVLQGHLDTDKNGRLRVGQLLAARDWTFARLLDRRGIDGRSDLLVLAHLDARTPDGLALKESALRVLERLAKADRTTLSLAELRAWRGGVAKTLANGDGVVTPEQIEEAEVQAFSKDIVATVGGVPDASGSPGIGAAQLDAYLEGAKALLDWKARAISEGEALFPLGDGTGAALAALDGVAARIDGWFLQSDLLRHESQTAEALRLGSDEWKALKAQGSAALEKFLADAPLIAPDPSGLLPLDGQMNPQHAAAWGAFTAQVSSRLLAADVKHLDRAAWKTLRATFEAHRSWQAAKPAAAWDAVADRVALQRVGELPEKLRALQARDLAAKPEIEVSEQLEKLLLLQRWLLELANNVVNFSAVYRPDQTALVEMGSLVVDGRRLDFCVKVTDRAAHKKVAADSLIFLVYAAITEADGKPASFEIAAPVTAGEQGRLRAGKRGLFIDTAGKEWDATIVDVVEHPISLMEAVKSPFRRASKFISTKVEEFGASQLSAREKAATAQMDAGVLAAGTTVVNAPGAIAAAPAAKPADAAKPAAAPAPTGGGMSTLLMGGGLAFAAIGSALAYVVSAIASVKPLSLLLALAGVAAFIGGISGFLGWLKLRRRDMGLLFEANGWAINPQMRLDRRIGRVFTRTPRFPEGTRIELRDQVESAAIDDDEGEDEGGGAWVLAVALLLSAATVWVWVTFFRG